MPERCKKKTNWWKVFMIISIVLTLIYMVYLTFSVLAKVKAVTGNGCCGTEGFVCKYDFNDNIKIPGDKNMDDLDDKQIGLFLGDLVYRLEFASFYKKTLQVPPGLVLLKTINDKDGLFCALYKSKDPTSTSLFITFKGTTTISEWIADSKLKQGTVQAPFQLNNPKILKTNKQECDLNKDIQIHSGFLGLYKKYLEKEIKKTIKEHPEVTNIFITGHSLGAAIATITAFDLSFAVSQKIYCSVFACPRVGNSKFTDIFEKQNNITKYIRFINNSDIVPTLPASVNANTIDSDKPYLYQHIEGIQYSFTKNYGSLENNHNMNVAYLNSPLFSKMKNF